MCSRSTGLMLRQNLRGWLKWSANVSGASRTFFDCGTVNGTSTNAPSSAPAVNGQPPSRELGRYGATPVCTASWWKPSRSMSLTGACVRLTGICAKLGPASRVICVSRYENSRPASSGSSVTSMPGTRWPGWNATCSVSAKKFDGFRFSVSSPIGCTGASSSGTRFVGSSRSIPSNVCSGLSGNVWMPSSHCGYAPASIASARSRRWKSGSTPPVICASSHTRECTPSFGFQWNFTSVVAPSALTSRKVWTPKPSIMRYDRGMPRSDMFHSTWWVASVCRVTKSQCVSCADCACGISRSGCGLAACTMSGNLIASWMKKTGMLFPTRSNVPSLV